MKKKILTIVNPISGTKSKSDAHSLLETYLNKDLFDYEIRYTDHPGHATEMARKAAENGYDIVVAVGGDGTVNEVARSLVNTPTALAIIPCGSGNGLARHLFIPLQPVDAIHVLNDCEIRALDYGTINDYPFSALAGWVLMRISVRNLLRLASVARPHTWNTY